MHPCTTLRHRAQVHASPHLHVLNSLTYSHPSISLCSLAHFATPGSDDGGGGGGGGGGNGSDTHGTTVHNFANAFVEVGEVGEVEKVDKPASESTDGAFEHWDLVEDLL